VGAGGFEPPCAGLEDRSLNPLGHAKGRISVRWHLFRQAAGNNLAAAIFLAKNLLGYRDVVNTEHTGLAW